MDADQDDERARLLKEMRAYGSATPFVEPQPGKRRNVFDEAAGEWLRSRTFKTILTITCLLAFGLFCVLPAFTIVFGGALAWDMIRNLMMAWPGG